MYYLVNIVIGHLIIIGHFKKKSANIFFFMVQSLQEFYNFNKLIEKFIELFKFSLFLKIYFNCFFLEIFRLSAFFSRMEIKNFVYYLY